jgi:hypothetical protein
LRAILPLSSQFAAAMAFLSNNHQNATARGASSGKIAL